MSSQAAQVEEPLEEQNIGAAEYDELFGKVPFTPLVIRSEQIIPQGGHCYGFAFQTFAGRVFSRAAVHHPKFTVLENGAALRNGNFLHDEIRTEGAGRVSMWNDAVYFSSSDNSDPRTNGREYSFLVPQFVHFLENLPPAGIQKFRV